MSEHALPLASKRSAQNGKKCRRCNPRTHSAQVVSSAPGRPQVHSLVRRWFWRHVGVTRPGSASVPQKPRYSTASVTISSLRETAPPPLAAGDDLWSSSKNSAAPMPSESEPNSTSSTEQDFQQRRRPTRVPSPFAQPSLRVQRSPAGCPPAGRDRSLPRPRSMPSRRIARLISSSGMDVPVFEIPDRFFSVTRRLAGSGTRERWSVQHAVQTANAARPSADAGVSETGPLGIRISNMFHLFRGGVHRNGGGSGNRTPDRSWFGCG